MYHRRRDKVVGITVDDEHGWRRGGNPGRIVQGAPEVQDGLDGGFSGFPDIISNGGMKNAG